MPAARAVSWIRRLRQLVEVEIWRGSELEATGPRARLFRLLRILLLCHRGIHDNRLFSRTGSLAFASLVGLAPLVALAIPIGAIVLGEDEDRAVRWLSRVVGYIAPHVAEFERQGAASPDAPETAPAGPESPQAGTEINPQLVQVLDGIIDTARSGTLGVIGAIALIVVVINLFTSVETTLNDIWRARRGRTWLSRIVIYWTVLTLGSLLALAALSLVSLAASARLDSLPLGSALVAIIRWSAAPAAALLLLGVLTIFYKSTPATPVHWQAALGGALVGSLLLVANHYSASLYVGRVVMEKSFYGQLGIVFVLMAGLYSFWLFVLIGAQLSYAVQNANYLCRDPDWENLSFRTRESYTLLCFLQVARAFRSCHPPLSVRDIATHLHLPNTIVHNCLLQLQSMGYVHFVETEDAAEIQTHRAQPARPLDTISLADFKGAFEGLGVQVDEKALLDSEPLLRGYRELIEGDRHKAIVSVTIDSLIDGRQRVPGEQDSKSLPSASH